MNYWEAAKDGGGELVLGQEGRGGCSKRGEWGETGELRTTLGLAVEGRFATWVGAAVAKPRRKPSWGTESQPDGQQIEAGNCPSQRMDQRVHGRVQGRLKEE